MKSCVIFGAGNVGRGFIGHLFSESGHEVVFVDVDEPLIAALNARHGYTIQLVDHEQTQLVEVSPVHALHSAHQPHEVAAALAQSSLAATAVGARILPKIAALVADGIRLRANIQGLEQSQEPLNIIICENLKDAAAEFRTMVYTHLSDAHQAYAQQHVGFVDTVIGRMVPPPTPEMIRQDPSFILVEPYKELPVDQNGFIGQIPDVVGMEPCANFPAYTARKLYVHNCAHAMLAYLGYMVGYQYGYEALNDSHVRSLLEKALSESCMGIVAEYGANPDWLAAHTRDLLQRFSNKALGDTIFRLGRDPLRKLAPKDRLVGAARLAEKAGIAPHALSWGIAAGYCFNPSDDPIAVSLQKQLKDEGLDAALESVSGILPGEPLAALVRDRYARLQVKPLALPP
jgi:mannitol-1-phosphate 5-dehydrogenase